MYGILLTPLDWCPSCYLELLDKVQKRICKTVGPSLPASLEPLAHHWNLVSLSLFKKIQYYFGRCSGIVSCFPGSCCQRCSQIWLLFVANITNHRLNYSGSSSSELISVLICDWVKFLEDTVLQFFIHKQITSFDKYILCLSHVFQASLEKWKIKKLHIK